MLSIRHAQYDFWAINVLWISAVVVNFNISEEILEQYWRDPEKFISQIVNQDETWIHHFDYESKQQSMQWIYHGFTVML